MEIFGAGGHCKVILDAAILSNLKVSRIWDDNPSLSEFAGFPISGNFSQLKLENPEEVVLAIGNNRLRRNLAEKIETCFCTVIHPSAVIADSVKIGEGSVVMANVTVNADCSIGKHAILNTSCSIDHDCRIHDFVHISPLVGLAGGVEVGEGSHIGIGALIIQGITIGKWATIGAGAVIIRDVPDYAVVVGNPGKIIKYNTI